MRARFTQYSVPGWGVGELWMAYGLVLAHEFRFDGATNDAEENVMETRASPPEGATRPPSGTVATSFEQVGNGSVPASEHLLATSARGSRAATVARALDPDDALVHRFQAFFRGRDPRLEDVEIDLDWTTPFQRAIATTLRGVPRGETITYGELAALAGCPGAARAAGSFCAHNRFMLVVPCHRVVGAGGLGGYGSAGISTKRRLLALEGVEA